MSMRKDIRIFDTNLRTLAPRDRFEAATTHGMNMILLIPEVKLNTINDITATAPDIHSDVMSH